MKRKSYRANNPVTVLNRVTATQFQDTTKAGTPRNAIEGGCYQGNSNAYVGCGTLGGWSIDDAVNSISMECSFFVNSFTKTSNALMGKSRGAATSERWGIVINNNGIVSSIAQSGQNIATGVTVETNYKLITTYNKTTNRLIGTLTNLDNNTSNTVNIPVTAGYITGLSNIHFLIAGYGNSLGNGGDFSGFELGDIKVWDVRVFTDSTLVAQYKCDETSGATSYDSSGNGRNGTIMNAVTVPRTENPNSIHQTQNIFSYPNMVGYSVRKFYSSIPSQFTQVGAAFTGGDLSYNAFDFTTVGNLGMVGGVYTDEIGQYVYCVSSLRLEARVSSLIFPTDASINLRIFLTNPASIRLEEDYTNSNSLRSVVFAYIAAKSISDTAPNTVDAYYQTASQADKDELDAIFSVRSVADWTTYFNRLPNNIKSSTSNISSAWIPNWIQSLQTGSTELQKIIVPEEPLSTNANNSNIRILGGLRARVDRSIISDRLRESRLYEYFVLENDETTLVPRDESQQLPPFRDASGLSLEFIGAAPNSLNWVNSACYKLNQTGYYRLAANNFDTLANFEFSFWIQPLVASGATLGNIIAVAKYNTAGQSSFQVQRPASNDPIQFRITDATNSSQTLAIIANENIQDNVGAVLKGTVRVFGNTVQTRFNDVGVATGTLTNGIRLRDIPFTIGATNRAITRYRILESVTIRIKGIK